MGGSIRSINGNGKNAVIKKSLTKKRVSVNRKLEREKVAAWSVLFSL